VGSNEEVNAREEKHFSISDNEFVDASYSMKMDLVGERRTNFYVNSVEPRIIKTHLRQTNG